MADRKLICDYFPILDLRQSIAPSIVPGDGPDVDPLPPPPVIEHQELLSEKLKGRVAIVTGSSHGLGRAIAILFAAHGAKLVVCADLWPENKRNDFDECSGVSTDALINKRYGGPKAGVTHQDSRAVHWTTDVGKSDSVKLAVTAAVQIGGRLDIMVNNAGIGAEFVKIHELDETTWDNMMTVNLRSVYLGCKFAIKQFLEQEPLKSSDSRGWIVNTASTVGVVGLKGGAAGYCASKGGVINLTKQVAVDYAEDKIHCNAVCPGFLRTPMSKPNIESKDLTERFMNATPWKTWGEVQDVAKGYLFLASDDAAWITGVALPIDGGMLAL